MLNTFLNINSATDNHPNVTNPIGELGAKGRTYSRDVRSYQGLYGSLELFKISDPSTFELNNTASICNTLMGFLDDFINTVQGPGNLIDIITTALTNACGSIVLGDLILNPIDEVLYPEFISFNYTDGGNVIPVKVWLSNASFVETYPHGFVNLVYPIASLQVLWDGYTQNAAIIAALSPTALITKLHNQITYPVTGVTSFTVVVQNRNNPDQSFDMPIAVGYNGNSFNIRANWIEQLRQDILGPENHTLEEWALVIPELLTSDRHYLIPYWNNVAITNVGIAYPIGSPTITSTDFGIMGMYFPDALPEDLQTYMSYFTIVYKSLGIFVMPDGNNAEGLVAWHDVFPDYFMVSLNDGNVDQMVAGTRDVSIAIDQLVRVAETWQDGVMLGSNNALEIHSGLRYICRTVGSNRICVLVRVDKDGL